MTWNVLTRQPFNAVDVYGPFPPFSAAALFDRAQGPQPLVRSVAEPDALHGLRLGLCRLRITTRFALKVSSRAAIYRELWSQ